MLKDERLEKITNYISQNQYVSLKDLTAEFGISRATVYRDLEYLDSQKQIVLTRGGARSIRKNSTYELPYFEKKKTNQAEKERIACAARKYIEPGDTIMIDSGTTSYELAVQMEGIQGVLAATNDLLIAAHLARYPDLELISIGGNIRLGFYTASGYFAASNVSHFHFDKVFFTIDSISLAHGCMITNADEVDVKRSMLAASNEIIVICDHTKFETTAFVEICQLNRIDKIITGKELDPAIYKDFMEHGVPIQLV